MKSYDRPVNLHCSQTTDLKLENGLLKEQIKDAEKERDLLIQAINEIKLFKSKL